MAKIRVILDSGNEFIMVCKEAKMTYSKESGKLITFEYDSCTKNRPIYIDVTKVAAVIREDVQDGE